MNRNDLLKIKSLAIEIKSLEKTIARWPTGNVADYATDYRTGHPRIISLVGNADCQHLKGNLRRSRAALGGLLLEAELWIESLDDPEMRTIFRLKYFEGLNYSDIGEELGYTAESIKQKVKRFWKAGAIQ